MDFRFCRLQFTKRSPGHCRLNFVFCFENSGFPKCLNKECNKEEAEQTGNEVDHGKTRSREKFERGAGEARHSTMHTNGMSRFSVCDKECKQLNSLKENVNIDTGEKSFVCSICSQRFNSNVSLRNHELVHSDLSPYVCSICPERFERSDKLKDHVKKHDVILARMWYVTLYVYSLWWFCC